MERDASVSNPRRLPRTLLEEILQEEELTARELEVLDGQAAGETATETGHRLFLSGETVRYHRKRVFAKLVARNGAHAVAIALRKGLIS